MENVKTVDAHPSPKDDIILSEVVIDTYILRTTLHDGAPYGCSDFETEVCYTLDGDYIGDPDSAAYFFKLGIEPELISPKHKHCQIGFCEKEQKWYGWSHRAVTGFGIGSIVEQGDCGYRPDTVDEIYLEHLKWYADFKHTDTPPSVRDYDNGCLIIENEHSMPVYPADDCDPQDVAERMEPHIVDLTMSANDEVKWVPAPSTFQHVYIGRGKWTAETLDDARQMAVDFAKGVS